MDINVVVGLMFCPTLKVISLPILIKSAVVMQ